MVQLTNVRPGDLIRAADWNTVIATLQGLSGQAAAVGPITVPNLFGLPLGNAVAILTLPATQLAVGTVLDSLGNTVDPSAAGSVTLLVINQVPWGGANVYAGNSVNLVVAPKPGSVPPPPLVPAIQNFKQNPVAIGAQVEIDGQNFDPTFSNNTVTFAGVQGTVASNSNKLALFVTVPAGIPNSPPPGQNVSVIVTTPGGGASAPGTLAILPPLSTPLPTITNITPTGGSTVGKDITFAGTGFDSTPGNNTVNFTAGSPTPVVTATPKSASQTQLVVTIPTGIPGLNRSGDFVSANISVTVAGQTSATKPYLISMP